MDATLPSDCEYHPPVAAFLKGDHRGLAGGAPSGAPGGGGDTFDSDVDYEADSDYSDDSYSLNRRRRKAAGAGGGGGGVRKPSSGGGGGGGGGGTRVLHRWTAEEHARLEALVRQYGTERNWALIAEGVRGRSGKQCRERWLNHMRDGIIK
jgi:hypothetical protein